MKPDLEPMPLWLSLLYFGIPTVLELILLLWVLPTLDRSGAPPIVLFCLWASPLVLMVIAALVGHRLEGRPLTLVALRERLRLEPMSGRGWWWAAGLALFNFATYVGMAFLISPLAKSLPSAPEIAKKILGDSTTFVGFPMAGAWWLLGVWFLFYLVNVAGEELWWRGYILPRQELQHGERTWIIHGILWTLFHCFYGIEALMILPGALALSWVCQRQQSTWPGLVAHGFLNAFAAIRLIMGILG